MKMHRLASQIAFRSARSYMTFVILEMSTLRPLPALVAACTVDVVRPMFVAVVALHIPETTVLVDWFSRSAQSESFFWSDELMLTRCRLARSSLTMSRMLLPLATAYDDAVVVPEEKRFVRLL